MGDFFRGHRLLFQELQCGVRLTDERTAAMGSDSSPLWDEYDSLPPLPSKRRSWKTELIGAVVVVLGFACGILGAKWGSSKKDPRHNWRWYRGDRGWVIPSLLRRRPATSKAIVSTVGMVMVLGGPYYLLALGFEAGASWPGCVGPVIFYLGLGLVFERTIKPEGLCAGPRRRGNPEIQEGEHQAEIDRELKAEGCFYSDSAAIR